jgi:hypothetical protein
MTGGVIQDSSNLSYFYKNTGTNGDWDGQVYSSGGLTSGAFVAFRRNDPFNYVMMGLNTDPATNASYATIDYAWYPYYTGGVQIYENGSYIGEYFGTYNSSTKFLITYDNSSVRYWIDGRVYLTRTPGSGITFYIDSSFYYTGTSGFVDVGFGTFAALPAYGAQGPTGVTGVSGAQGPVGTPGAQGRPGATGAQGAQGPRGPQGPTGPTGAQGPQGGGGPTGIPGGTGASGAQGPSGFQGPQGATSTLGTQTTALGVNIAASTTGTLQATSTITAGFSDIRLKDNIESIKNAAEKLYQLNGVFYTQSKLGEIFGYKDYSRKVGLIAQEVQKVVPEIVKPAPFDIDENGQSKSGENYLTVQYEKMIPLIVETIKQQQKEIEELEKVLNGN